MTLEGVKRVAVLSDVHGVLPALDAVLAEPDVAAAHRIVLTGDVAAGPQPVAVVDRLVDLGERVVWVGATPTVSSSRSLEASTYRSKTRSRRGLHSSSRRTTSSCWRPYLTRSPW